MISITWHGGAYSEQDFFDLAWAYRTRCTAAADKLGVRASLIMCFLRHLDEVDAETTFDAVPPHQGKIIGVGLNSWERGKSPQ